MGEVRVDPERAWVDVRPQLGPSWAVTIQVAEFPDEESATREAERLVDALGLVGPDWVRRSVAAERLGVGVKMVDKLRRQGRLRGRYVARTNRAYVHQADVEAELHRRSSVDGGGL